MDFKVAKQMNKIEANMNKYYLERKDVINAISTGLLANQNVIEVGPPGTAKTAISEAWISHITDAKHFGTTLNPFTTPEEVFGAMDLKKYKEQSIMMHMTDNYLPTAHMITIEELFKAGKGMLNSFIEVAHHDRIYTNGPIKEKTPILMMIGTSNELPVDDEALAAIYDRMHIKIYVQPMASTKNFIEMITNQKKYEIGDLTISLDDIYKAREEVLKVKINEGIAKRISVLREDLFKQGVCFSDRTSKLAMHTLQAQAYLACKKEATDTEIMFLRHMLWRDPSEENTVWAAILSLVNPELKKINEIFKRAGKTKENAIKEKSNKKMITAHKQIQARVDEIKVLKRDMVKKRRDVSAVDEILNKLVSYLNELSHKLIGITSSSAEDEMFE